jgi:serine/threonine-protein kinase RsbW
MKMGNTEEIKTIKIDDNSSLFNKTGMFYKEFPSDYRQIRYFTLLVVQTAPPEIKEINLLEQQVSELIKNAVKHGNKNKIEKKVKVWYLFNTEYARIIVEDEGEGFKNLEEWNDFNKERTMCFIKQDFENMAQYVSFRTEKSDENDGGNALFAAVEYWNGGVVFTSKKNCIAVKKNFPKKRFGVKIE